MLPPHMLDLLIRSHSSGVSAVIAHGQISQVHRGKRLACSHSWARLGFDVIGDEALRALVLTRIVEPTSKADTRRVIDVPRAGELSRSERVRAPRRVGAYGPRSSPDSSGQRPMHRLAIAGPPPGAPATTIAANEISGHNTIFGESAWNPSISAWNPSIKDGY